MCGCGEPEDGEEVREGSGAQLHDACEGAGGGAAIQPADVEWDGEVRGGEHLKPEVV